MPIEAENALLVRGTVLTLWWETKTKMKRLIALVFMLSAGYTMWSMNPGHGLNHNCIHVISMTDGTFHFRSDRDVAGASIEVYSYKTGEKVLTQTIKEKRTSVSLRAQEPGDYIILITKGDFKRKYVYHRTSRE